MNLEETIQDLQKISQIDSRVLVSFSNGKDSRAILHLAKRFFKKVVCFFLYYIPEADYNKDVVKYVENQGIICLQYPHESFFQDLKNAVFCDDIYGNLDTYSRLDIYNLARKETGFHYILNGAKKADSFWRRRQFGNEKADKYKGIIYPVKEWSKLDIIAYLKMNNIEMPEMSKMGMNATGISLATPHLLWLHDNKPDDYKKLLRYFPYAHSIVKRREFYGIE